MSTRRGKLHSPVTVNAIGRRLETMAAKPKGLTLEELITRLARKIEAARHAGHSLSDIVAVFGKRGIQISEESLSRYLQKIEQAGDCLLETQLEKDSMRIDDAEEVTAKNGKTP